MSYTKILLFPIVAFIITGCGQGGGVKVDYDNLADTTMVPGDWAVLHQLADPDILNPITSRGAGSSAILGHIFESLLTLDKKTLVMKPYLAAELPQVSKDRLRYTFTLRKDATFTDGEPVTAHDLLFTVKAIKNPLVDDAPLRGYYASLKDVTVSEDGYTITFTCEKPYFKNDEFLGGMEVLPKHIYDPQRLTDKYTLAECTDLKKAEKNPALKAFGTAFNEAAVNRAPVGSGPYMFEKWEANQQVVLKRNDAWWKKGDPESPNYLEQIVYRTINDMDAALVSLKNQDLDVLGLKPTQYLNQTGSGRFKAAFNKRTNITPGYTYIGWNQKRPYFAQKEVRHALSRLVDVDRIIKVVNKGFAVRIATPVFYQKKACHQGLKPIPYDPETAKKMLDQAGWIDADGDGVREKTVNGKKVDFSFTILINSGNDLRKQIALIVTEEFKKAGIACDVRELEWSVFLNNIDTHQYDATILGWALSILKDDPYQLWHSSQAKEKGSNFTSFRNDRVDEIIEIIRTNFDEEKRLALMKEFQEIIYDEQPYTFLYSSQALLALHKRFRNVQLYPSRPGFDLHEWGVPKAVQRYTK